MSTGIRSVLWAYLAEQASLTGGDAEPGLLGSPTDARIYPHGAPARPQFPHVVFKRVDRPEQRTLTATRGIRSATFDFEVWGDDTDVVESVVEAMRAALEAARQERDGIAVRSVELQGEVDDSVRPDDGSEVTWFVTVVTARFQYVNLNVGA